MRALVLSAYAADSHRYWQERLVQMLPGWRWRTLSLPPRHFSWRVRGNPLFWSVEEREVLTGDYDVVLATSMVDLATLRGLVPELTRWPTLLYFHENQFAYPRTPDSHSLLEAQMVSIYAALAADRLAFNSEYNRSTFLAGCEALFQKLPDYVPDGIVDGFRAKSAILPVPIDTDGSSGGTGSETDGIWSGRNGGDAMLRICWVGRFEHDKGAGGLLNIVRMLERFGVPFELGLVGQQFRHIPAPFEQLQTEFPHRLVQFGYIPERQGYLDFLATADVVISTADHEFQGIAVLEAVACGCVPVLPRRLAYTELFPEQFLYASSPEDPDAEALAASALLLDLAPQIRAGLQAAPNVSRFQVATMASHYSLLLGKLAVPRDSHSPS